MNEKEPNYTLIDNSKNLQLVDYLNQFIKNEKITEIDIATGYWDLKGTALIKDSLKEFLSRENTKLNLLIGKDPNLLRKELTDESYKNAKVYPKDYLKIDLENVEMTDSACQEVCNLLIEYCETKEPKIEVRIFKTNEDDKNQFFHSKCYIFNGKKNGSGYGILGSSNFTKNGLLENSELNYLECDVNRVLSEDHILGHKTHLQWFKEKWNLADNWTKEFLLILQESKVYKEQKNNKEENIEQYKVLTPKEIYYKFLIDQFDDIITFDGKITPKDYLPKDSEFKHLSYQIEAVNQGFSILQKHKGFILADVVGLGKTFTTLMVVKRHLLEIGFTKHILIITPPAIKKNWLDSIDYFDKDEVLEKHIGPFIKLSTINCLDTELETLADDIDLSFKQNDFSMIIVDESHNFRNDSTMMYQKLYDLIGEVVPQPYVVLLSATPQNNSPYDLRNQIYLFEREVKKSTLNNLGQFGNNLEGYFAEKQKNYKDYIKKTKIINGEKILKSKEEIEKDRLALIEDSEDIRKKIVEPLIIRRTRTDIEKYYKNDKATQNLYFPHINAPIAIPYEMKDELATLFIETVDIIATEVSHIDSDELGNQEFRFSEPGDGALGYYRYRAIEFLSKKNSKRYEKRNLTAEGTSKRLAQIMELSLVKRLESSQTAFKESLHNLKRYTENMIKMWKANRIFICPDIDVNKELNDASIEKNKSFENCLDVIAKKAEKANLKYSGTKDVGANLEFKQSDFEKDRDGKTYIQRLQSDLELITYLCQKWDEFNNDPKLEKFIAKCESQFFNKENNPEQKLVIFTECIATQKILVQKLKNVMDNYNTLSITAQNCDEMKEEIAANFDANYKGKKKDDYQILVTTDVLAEGVNLHRSNTIINYDSPWNATRLMQRLGRINRIGSTAKEIWNYNFYPSTLGDDQINLKNRTFVKLQAFHELFGEDSQIFSKEEDAKHHELIMHDAEDNSLSPITPFIAELKDLKENHFGEYARLKNITDCAVTFTNSNIYFASVCERHVCEQKQGYDFVNSSLYMAQKNDNSMLVLRTSQIEFFERLKEMLKQVQHDNNFQGGHDKVAQLQQAILNKIDIDLQEATLAIKSKSKVNNTTVNQALAIIKNLQSQENITEHLFDILDKIKSSIRNHNSTLTKKVLELDLTKTKDGLFSNFEPEILSLQKYIHSKTYKNINAKIAIAMLGE